MSKWREVRLGEIVTFKTGRLNSNQAKEQGKYPFYTCSQEIFKTDTYAFDTECIILGGNNAEAKYPIFYKEGKFNAYQRNYVIEPKTNDTNIRFMFYALFLRLEHMRKVSTGATTKFLTLRILNSLKVKIPDLKTQEKIAHLLSTYDELIENNNRRIEILEKASEEIYKEWFVRMRFPGYKNAKFIKGIPEGWEVKKIGDIAKFRRGRNLRIADAIVGEVPVIAGGIEPSCYHNESNTKAPVVTVSASGANAGYTKLNYIDVWASDCSYIDIEDTEFIYYIFLLLIVSYVEIVNLQVGAAQPHVYAKDLNDFKFLMPKLDFVRELNNMSEITFNRIKYLTLQNQNLVKQRDLLLPRLMNGAIEIN